MKSEMFLDGKMVDYETTSFSGYEAGGTHELRNRGGHGQIYEITLTVTDADGNEASETKTIDLKKNYEKKAFPNNNYDIIIRAWLFF